MAPLGTKENKEKKFNERKFRGKKKYKLNKLIVFLYLNSFYLFLSII